MSLFNISLLLLTTCLAACVPEIKGQQQLPTGSKRILLSERCQSLRKEGDVGALILGVNADTEKLLALLSNTKDKKLSPEIVKLKNQIQTNLASVLSMLKSPFSQLDFEQNIHWTIDEASIHELDTDSQRWKIASAQVIGVYTWDSIKDDGEHSSDLKLAGLTKISVSDKDVQVELQRPAHALELCQLQNALGVELGLNLVSTKGTKRFKQVILSVQKLENL